MIEALRTPEDPSSILRALGSVQAQIASVELARAQLVLAWADAHPGDHLVSAGAPTLPWTTSEQAVAVRDAEAFLGGERALELGGEGTPLVAEPVLRARR